MAAAVREASLAAKADASVAVGSEPSLASSLVSFCYPGALGASKAHKLPVPAKRLKQDGVVVKVTWADPPTDQQLPKIRGGTSVSPEGLILKAVSCSKVGDSP